MLMQLNYLIASGYTYWVAKMTAASAAFSATNYTKLLSNGDFVAFDGQGSFVRLDTSGNLLASVAKTGTGYPVVAQNFCDSTDNIRCKLNISGSAYRDCLFDTSLAITSQSWNATNGQGYIGTDSSGNTYEISNPVVSSLLWAGITKRNSAGVVQWSNRLRKQALNTTVIDFFVTPSGWTYTLMYDGATSHYLAMDTNGGGAYILRITNSLAAYMSTDRIYYNPQNEGEPYFQNTLSGQSRIIRGNSLQISGAAISFLCADSLGNIYVNYNNTKLIKYNSSFALVWTRDITVTGATGYIFSGKCTTSYIVIMIAFGTSNTVGWCLKYPADGSITGTFGDVSITSGASITVTVATPSANPWTSVSAALTAVAPTSDTPTQPVALSTSNALTQVV